MFIITMIKEGSLQLSAYATKKETLIEVVRRWFNANYSSYNDKGYIAVEEVNEEGATADRIMRINLDEEPEEVEEYLQKLSKN